MTTKPTNSINILFNIHQQGSLLFQEEEPKIESNYYLEIESFKNTVVLQVESKDDLLSFINECHNLLNYYEE